MAVTPSGAQRARNLAADWLAYCEAARDNLADKRPRRRGCGFYAWCERRADKACDKAERSLTKAQAAYEKVRVGPPSPARQPSIVRRVEATHAAMLHHEAMARLSDAMMFHVKH